MSTAVLSSGAWAQEQFGSVNLGDKRRTERAVQVATAMAQNPSGSIPQQNKQWSKTKGAYRLFDSQQASFQALIEPHWQQTRSRAAEGPVVLLIQDTTELDYTSHPACGGLGRFGNGSGGRATGGLGLLLHSVLALEPMDLPKPPPQKQPPRARVLGLVWNHLWARTGPVRGKALTPRQRFREPGPSRLESDRWIQAVKSIGAAPAQRRWIHVGDREADLFALYEACGQYPGVSFLVRVTQKRRTATGGHVQASWPLASRKDRPRTTLQQVAESMPVLGGKSIWIAGRKGQPGRWANCLLSGGAVTIYSPWNRSCRVKPLNGWVVRVWEVDAQPSQDPPIEWILLSNEPVNHLEEALRLADWYALRWMIEQYHQCLKSGCNVEKRQLEHVDRLRPLIAMLCVLAVRLLQLSNDTRQNPQRPALDCVPVESVQTLAKMLNVAARGITLGQFTHEVAKLGGFLGRKNDGPPGWRTLWRGWHELDQIAYGVQLSAPRMRSG